LITTVTALNCPSVSIGQEKRQGLAAEQVAVRSPSGAPAGVKAFTLISKGSVARALPAASSAARAKVAGRADRGIINSRRPGSLRTDAAPA